MPVGDARTDVHGDGLPVAQSMNWEYQVFYERNVWGLNMGRIGNETVVALAAQSQKDIITAVARIPFGNGQVILSTLTMLPHLDSDRPFDSMARAYSLVILNNNLNHRLHLMEGLVKEYHVDGLVIHSARSCKPYSVGQYDLKRLLMDRLGVPSVIIEGDITDSRAYSEEQARTRLDAFFETMEN